MDKATCATPPHPDLTHNCSQPALTHSVLATTVSIEGTCLNSCDVDTPCNHRSVAHSEFLLRRDVKPSSLIPCYGHRSVVRSSLWFKKTPLRVGKNKIAPTTKPGLLFIYAPTRKDGPTRNVRQCHSSDCSDPRGITRSNCPAQLLKYAQGHVRLTRGVVRIAQTPHSSPQSASPHKDRCQRVAIRLLQPVSHSFPTPVSLIRSVLRPRSQFTVQLSPRTRRDSGTDTKLRHKRLGGLIVSESTTS